jgi:hypothetical protein
MRIYKTIILPVVLYGCEIWSLTLRDEHRVRVFENKVLRRILGPRRDEVMGGRRKLHNQELRDLYSSSIITIVKSMRLRWAGHVARMGEKREMRIGYWWESQRERDHYEDQDERGLKMDLLEIGWGGVDLIGLAQDRDKWRALANAVMNLRVP